MIEILGARWARFTFLLILTYSTTSQAVPGTAEAYKMFPVLQCPSVGDEYSKMIGKLEVMKTTIKDKANCKTVTTQLETLQQLLDTDRQKVLGLIDKANGQPLSPAEAKAVQDYAQALTQKVATLNDLFTNGNQCFSEDGSGQSLSALSGFVNEAASLVGSVAGPYGAPIALAGNVIAGFMTGLDQVLKSRAGYDFSKRDQWLSYVQNLCTYYSYRDQIDHLLNPSSHLAELNLLKSKLNSSLGIITQECDECRSLQSDVAAKGPAFVSLDGSSTVQTFIVATDKKYAVPFGSYTVQYLGLLDWVNREIVRIEKEMQSDWGNVSGQYLLARAKDQIEDFLVTRTAPQFLAFQINQAHVQFSLFQEYVRQEGSTLYSNLTETSKGTVPEPVKSWFGWVDPLDLFRKLIIQPIHWETITSGDRADELKAQWQSFDEESLLKLNSAQTTTRVAMTFCSFFKNAKEYSEAIRTNCGAKGTLTLVQEQSGLWTELKASPTQSTEATPEIPAEDVINPAPNSKTPFAQTRLQSLILTIEAREKDLR